MGRFEPKIWTFRSGVYNRCWQYCIYLLFSEDICLSKRGGRLNWNLNLNH